MHAYNKHCAIEQCVHSCGLERHVEYNKFTLVDKLLVSSVLLYRI